MTRACCSFLIAALLAVAPFGRASAAGLPDPDSLYATMQAAVARNASASAGLYNRVYALSTVFDAGRAFSLQAPDDPRYTQVKQLTVDLASNVHYNPLTNHDAVDWYVREAAAWVMRNPGETPDEVAKAQALLQRLDAADQDPNALATLADQDAAANIAAYPADPDALIQRVEADWRAWLLTGDPAWRAWALVRASAVEFPIGNLPSTWGPEFLNAARSAARGNAQYTSAERSNAQTIVQNLRKLTALKVIASVNAHASQDQILTTLAPADEYFGPMGMSILGMRNELRRVNIMIGYGEAKRQSDAAIQVAVAIDDLHKVYPHDRDVPQLLFDIQDTLAKIDTPEAAAARAHVRSILTVEYQDTKQAREALLVH